jgi:DHA1 family bicyclomycin/chloramphenicol resistance-like MFS transporter
VLLAIIPGMGQASMMAWVISSPFLIRQTYGLSATLFSVIFACCGVFLILGAQANAAAVRRFTPQALLRTAVPVALTAAVVLLALTMADAGGLAGLLVPLCVVLFVNGMGPPNATALALSRHGEAAGAASALIGTMQAAMSAVIMASMAAIGEGQLGMAGVQVGVLTVALLVLVAGGYYRRARPGKGTAPRAD